MRLLILVFLLVSCVPQPATPRETSAGGVRPVDCVPDDAASAEARCNNMLPREWQKLDSDGDVEELLKSIARIPLQAGDVTEPRAADPVCSSATGPGSKAFPVSYRAPQELLRHPRAGTQQRDLVVAVFTAVEDKGCAEARYAIRDEAFKDEGWVRMSQFITVVTGPASTHPTADTPIGRWQGWIIERKRFLWFFKNYRIRLLPKSGTYMQCGQPHNTTRDFDYIDCDKVRVLSRIVSERSLPGIETIDQAWRQYKARTPSIMRFFSAERDGSEDSSWGRCGALGCCAAEY